MPSYLFRLNFKQSCAVVIGARAKTAQLYPGHNRFEFIKVHKATRWTIRHSLMLHWFADLMNVTEEVTIHIQ